MKSKVAAPPGPRTTDNGAPADFWSEHLRKTLAGYDETLLRNLATRLFKPRNQWPVDELLERCLTTLGNAAVIDRRIKELEPIQRRVLALIAHDEDVVIPSFATDKIHYEGELVVVIGKKAKHLTEANAMDCVFGYTIGNDVSERSWQKADRGLWRAKNADTFKPMGPWIETDVDLDRMETVIRVNGKETGRFRTNDMIFGIVPFLVELTKYFTLWPGDVIWMGTDGASPDLKHGDDVEIDITGIGTLRNRFIREGS